MAENKKVFTTAAWIWLCYLILQLLIDIVIYHGRRVEFPVQYYALNFISALIFLGLSFTKWIRRLTGVEWMLMVLIISIVPILMPSTLNVRFPEGPLANIEGRVLRQMPVLLIGLVLVAWRYPAKIIILYSLATFLFELLAAWVLNPVIASRFHALFFTTMIRTVCFLLIGFFINRLIRLLKTQQQSLTSANQKLTNYAATMEELTISRERNRVSRELHDTVIHSLSGLAVQLETIKAYLDKDKEVSARLIDQALQSTRSGLSETRRALKDLRASPLEDLGLIEAIRELALSAKERGSLELSLKLPEHDFPIPPNIEQAIYRVIQEAVENVIHHANATKLTITLTDSDRDMAVLVMDDGIGFNTSRIKKEGHYGLAGMVERTQLVGGELKLSSWPNEGTRIEVLFKDVLNEDYRL